jgi:general transcriptional corepressor CYC8
VLCLIVSGTGRVAEQMNDLEHALSAYENALRHNPMSMSGLTQVAGIARIKENYPKVGPFPSQQIK